MIARIYPFVRLPRRFDFFDYKIPETMEVNVGDVVRIRFRGRPMLGVIKEIVETSEFKKLFSIEEQLLPEFMSKEDVARFESIAEAIVQAPATVFYSSYGFIKGRKTEVKYIEKPKRSVSISKDLVESVLQAMKAIEQEDELFIQTSIEGSFVLAHALRKKFKDQVLIIAPRGRVAIDLCQSIDLGDNVGFLTGQSTAPVREATVKAWRNGEIKTLVATRLGARLAAKKISTILILESSSDDYITLARNPRIDARLAAELLAKQHGAKLVHCGPVPDVISLHKKRHILWEELSDVEVVNLKVLQERTNTPLLTQSLEKYMVETLQKGEYVLVSFNRRVAKEGSKLPGNKELSELFAKAFPSYRIAVQDKMHKENGAVIIVTEAYFKNTLQPFQRKQFGLVVELDFDLSFVGTDYRAKENAAYKLYRLIHIAKQQKAKLIVQTWMPEAVQDLLNAEKFLTEELALRKSYKFPPVFPRAEISYQDREDEFLPLNEENKESLKNLPDNCIIVINTDSYESTKSPHPSE